jgi:hypothetical protein
MNWLNLKMVRKRLGVSERTLKALVQSGLLGYTSATGMISDQAILSYEKFGTQWDVDERFGPSTRTIGSEAYDRLPEIEGIGPQPPATQKQGYVWPANTPDSLMKYSKQNDMEWIAHFYLVTNYFYFPEPTELALVGLPPLKLSESKRLRQ